MKQLKKPNNNKDIITIGDEYTGANRPSYICNYCNRTLTKLTDRNNQNESWYCNSCSIEFQPENESIRHKQKLEVPDRNIEPAIATTPGIPDIRIHHEPEPKGTFKVLQQKGIKITKYEEK